MNKYDELIAEHQALQKQLADQPDMVDVKHVLQLVTQIRDASAYIGDSQQREQLRAMLKHWGAFIYERTGRYPATQLAPHELDGVRGESSVDLTRLEPVEAPSEMIGLYEERETLLEKSPFGLYVLYVLLLLFALALFFAVLYPLLPPPFYVFTGWLSALSGGSSLASLVLLLLMVAWLKGCVRGLIATELVFLVWLGCIYLVAKPSGSTATLLALLLGLCVPLLAVLWFLRPLGVVFSALASILWVALWVVLTFLLKQYSLGALLMICALGTTAVFLIGLYLTAGFLLPVIKKHGKRGTVFSCLRDYALGWNYPYYMVTDEPQKDSQVVQRSKGNPFSTAASGPGLIITDSNHAVAITDGLKFKGVKGPGVIFTGFADEPMCTLDLRPQLRAFLVQGLTQDGIQVKVLAYTAFQIDRVGREPQLGKPLPYNKAAAFRALHAQVTEHPKTQEKTKRRAWDELPQIFGTCALQDIFSRYRFDELYGPYDIGTEPPRNLIVQELLSRLRNGLQPLGIHLVGGGIGNILPSKDEVLEQRMRTWKAEWARRVMLKQAEGQSDRLRLIERARAEAEADLILSLGRRIEDLTASKVSDDAVSPEEIVLQFLVVLEQLSLQPTLKRHIPQETAQDVRRLRETFEK